MNTNILINLLLMGIITAAVVIMVISKNVFYTALALLVCLLLLAVIFALQNAEFIAICQIMIYAGGIMILLIFGIMLTGRVKGNPPTAEMKLKWPAFILSGILLVMLWSGFNQLTFNETGIAETHPISVSELGISLMSDYEAPFEFSGILLLISLVGATHAATSYRKNR